MSTRTKPKTDECVEYVEMWRLDWRKWPERVRVAKVSFEFYLVEGDEHTIYKGNFFETPEAAFGSQIEECERRIKRSTEELENLHDQRARFDPKTGKLRPKGRS